MKLHICSMYEEQAQEILKWKYEEPYDFYNNEPSAEAMDELLAGGYYAVCDEHEVLVGFYCVGKAAQVPNDSYVYSEDYIDIGLGMQPAYTGQRRGGSFFACVLDHIENNHGTIPKRLTVAKFNRRAIHLYKKFGFSADSSFVKGAVTFIVMSEGDR